MSIHALALVTGSSINKYNQTKTALRDAVSKLNEGSMYACVMDIGLQTNFVGWSGYDTHSSYNTGITNVKHKRGHIEITFNNLNNLFGLIASGEMFNQEFLNETLIVINTEMGRDYRANNDIVDGCASTVNSTTINEFSGRDHWVQSYVVMFVGGPIKGRSIAGEIVFTDDCTPIAVPGYNPQDIRAACFMASGIDPFSPDLYGDVSTSSLFSGSTKKGSSYQTMKQICHDIFGVTIP